MALAARGAVQRVELIIQIGLGGGGQDEVAEGGGCAGLQVLDEVAERELAVEVGVVGVDGGLPGEDRRVAHDHVIGEHGRLGRAERGGGVGRGEGDEEAIEEQVVGVARDRDAAVANDVVAGVGGVLVERQARVGIEALGP